MGKWSEKCLLAGNAANHWEESGTHRFTEGYARACRVNECCHGYLIILYMASLITKSIIARKLC
jgi:hypothetical protein